MKKLAALLLILVLCLGSALAEAVDYTGPWYFVEATYQGQTLLAVELGMDTSMTLNADGTAYSQAQMQQLPVTWVATDSGVMIYPVVEGAALEVGILYTLEGDRLVAEDEGLRMVYSRDRADGGFYAVGEAKADATMDDYNGTWVAKVAQVMGMQVPMAETNRYMILRVDNGMATLGVGETKEEYTIACKAVVENGALLLMDMATDEEGFTLQLNDAGRLVMTQELGENMTGIVYLERQTDAE